MDNFPYSHPLMGKILKRGAQVQADLTLVSES